MPEATMRRRLLTTSSVVTAGKCVAGEYTLATLATLLTVTVGALVEMIIPMGPALDGKRKRGAAIGAMGSGADNSTMTFRVWQGKYHQVGDKKSDDFELQLLGTVVNTFSTLTGPAAGPLNVAAVAATERIADTMVWTQGTNLSTPKGIGDLCETVGGAPISTAYSPADNTPARMFITDCGNGDFLLIEPWCGTATGANALVEVGT